MESELEAPSVPAQAPEPTAVPVPNGALGALESAVDAESQLRLEVEARVRAAVRILVIDREVEAADRVVMLLERAGYEAEIATDSAGALSLADRFQPHLIILGPISNSVDNTELARALRLSAHDIAPSGDLGGDLGGFGGSSSGSMSSAAPEVPILHLVDRAKLLQQRLQTLGTTPLSAAIMNPIDERELLDKVARALASSA